MQHVYLDHASTTPLIEPVIQEMNTVMREHFGNASSIHHHGRQAKMLVENARKTIAKALGASIGEIFFCSSATEAHNMILTNSIKDLGVQRIISSPIEHHCIIHTLDHLASITDVEIVYLDVDKLGSVDLDQLEGLLTQDKKKTLVSLMYVNNEIGNIIDILRVSEICTTNSALFHCDTVQGIGKLPLNVNDAPMAFLAGSAHKFNGPKGVGFFYMNGDNIISPMMYGGAQERNMRAGTENIIGITGMAVALEKAIEQKEERADHIKKLNRHMRTRLDELDEIIINGTNQIDNILSVSFPATERVDMLMLNLDISRISASSGSACSSGIEHDSHVLQHIGHSKERKTIRFSFSHFNTIEEIDYVIEKLKKFTPIKEAYNN